MAVLKIESFKYQEQSKLVKVLSNSIEYLEPGIQYFRSLNNQTH